VKRGEVWWVDLDVPHGSAPGCRRPLIVISADAYNRSRIATFIGVAVTTNLRLAGAPGNVLLQRGIGGLPEDSVANVSQIVTVDKGDLDERLGRLDTSSMRTLEAGLRRALGL